MANAEYRYKIIFADSPEDWEFFLFTDEPKSADDIESLIEYYSEVNSRNQESGGYCPVDIMDDLLADHDGWHWESDMFDDEIHITNW
jgi:hypothetical protein